MNLVRLLSLSLAAALAGCSPVGLLNAVSRNDQVTRLQDISYGSDPRQKLDVYLPKTGDAAPGCRPVAVFFYGGSWNHGERDEYAFVGYALAARGIITVIPDYRLYPEVRYPAFLRDSAAALAWASRATPEYGASRERLFVMGHSAGAYNAAMLALDPRWLAEVNMAPSALAGWIGLAGPYNFLPIEDPESQPVFNHPNYPEGTQPVDHVSPVSPPTLLIMAEQDKYVDPVRNTVVLAQRLRALQRPVDVYSFGSVSHITLIASFAWPFRWQAPVLDRTVEFIMDHSVSAGVAPRC